MEKTFFDAEIEIKLLSAEEALLIEGSLLPDEDDDWLPGIW